MRLYNIYFSCKAAYEGISALKVERRNDGAHVLKNWIACRDSLESLMKIKFISSDAEKAYKTIGIIERNDISPAIAEKTCGEFMRNQKVIMDKLSAVISLYESMKDGESKPGIDIRIPKCKDLQEYISLLKDINRNRLKHGFSHNE